MAARPTASVTAAVEGILDEAVLGMLLRRRGVDLCAVHGKRGKRDLLRNVRGYNHAAGQAPWILLVDLDQEPCAPTLRNAWLPRPARFMCCRIAVRSVEAWLLADRERLATHLSIPRTLVPRDVEALEHPKRAVVDLARRSRSRRVRETLVPRAGAGRQVGPGYTGAMLDFVARAWRPQVAAERCDSLARAIRGIEELLRKTRSRRTP